MTHHWRSIIPGSGGDAGANARRKITAAGRSDCLTAGTAIVGFVVGILAFRRMSLTRAVVGLMMGLTPRIVRYRSLHGSSDTARHSMTSKIATWIGRATTLICVALLAFFTLAGIESTQGQGNMYVASTVIDQMVASRGYRPPAIPKDLNIELPDIDLPGQVSAVGMTIVAEGKGYCLSMPSSDDSFDHYHSTTRRTDGIPCH